MKIDNARIFTADVYVVTGNTLNSDIKEAMNHCDIFGSYDYNEYKTNSDMVVIEFPKLGYVPVGYLTNVLKYINVKAKAYELIGKKVLKTQPSFAPEKGEMFVKNIKPLFSCPGKTSLQELIGIQKLQNDRDNTFEM